MYITSKNVMAANCSLDFFIVEFVALIVSSLGI